jgi:hypothetical protein
LDGVQQLHGHDELTVGQQRLQGGQRPVTVSDQVQGQTSYHMLSTTGEKETRKSV